MTDNLLHSFYENVILPQFEVTGSAFLWEESDSIGPDEIAFRLKTNDAKYILIWEDFGGLAATPQYIEETLKLSEDKYEYVQPISEECRPSLKLRFGNQYKFIAKVTGSFTLLKLK